MLVRQLGNILLVVMGVVNKDKCVGMATIDLMHFWHIYTYIYTNMMFGW